MVKFRKGDLVMVDERGKAAKYEILSIVSSSRAKNLDGCYEAKNVITGAKKTIMEEDILRLATPVDSSADLFPK